MLMALIKAMRPHQWVKNLLVFTSLVFAHKLGDPSQVLLSCGAFAVFCLLSSSVYLLNDIVDAESDRKHPRKKFRPVASGALSVRSALLAALILGAGALFWAWHLSDEEAYVPFIAIPASYLALQLVYSCILKRMLIVDCLCIALGFLLRVHAGSVVLGVSSSSWMLLCTFFFALFLAFGKRCNEVALDDTGSTRATLRRYTERFLDQMISSLSAVSILSYALYTLSEETILQHGSGNLIITVPLVVYGVFRYQFLVFHRGEGGDPSRLLFRDRPLIICGLMYVLVVWFAFVAPDLFLVESTN